SVAEEERHQDQDASDCGRQQPVLHGRDAVLVLDELDQILEHECLLLVYVSERRKLRITPLWAAMHVTSCLLDRKPRDLWPGRKIDNNVSVSSDIRVFVAQQPTRCVFTYSAS